MPVRPDTKGSRMEQEQQDAGMEARSTDSSSGELKEHKDLREAEVHNLAREFTTQSARSHHQSPFTSEGGHLDPKSPHFRAKDWAKAFYNVRYDSRENINPRVAGVAFRSLNVWGRGSPTDFQSSVGNSLLKLPSLFGRGSKRIDILQDLDGLILPGEQLCVLGPPGSGCSTLLKSIAGDTFGFTVDPKSYLNYEGISPKQMHTSFRGEAIYTAEVDAHFSVLPVAETLYFAALARAPRVIPGGITREQYAEHLRDVVMAMLGISHTLNTRVGDDYVRGVSGGERKRVTIAEATLSYAPLQCWDNSTRGLDSANAIEFCKTLRTQCDVFGASTCVAIYQAPQAAYELFDKVIVLYEGRQIYFGKADEARAYFERLGFQCPESQTTPDFLTSMSSPDERIVRPGFEGSAPRTSEEFAQCWKSSKERQTLLQQIEEYDRLHPLHGDDHDKFALSRSMEKSKMQRTKSPYNLSFWGQVRLCLWRERQKLKYDPSVPIAMLTMNLTEALIIASVFYNLPSDTSSFFKRGAVLFMLVLLNAFGSMLEIFQLYSKRKIVEKHNRYALYHPSAEALSSMVFELPYKVVNAIVVNTTLYFMTNLRREPGPYFFLLLIGFAMTMSMSMLFRLFASVTKTEAQALAPSSLVLMTLILYTGFAIPVSYMLDWASWIRWINPIQYGFEAAMVNEFNGRDFACTSFVPSGPSYENITAEQRACAAQGSVPGRDSVSGTAFVRTAFDYEYANRWRNFGLVVAITVFLMVLHLIMSELVASERSKGEVLVFRRGKLQQARGKRQTSDEETGPHTASIQEKPNVVGQEPDEGVEKQTSIFHWENVCYEVQIKKEKRQILDHVDGWIKPGTLTALMGVSGAGKTTLLDVLASRTTMGVITGSMFVDGRERDHSFQRQTGYVMQQDIHLYTSTVREALEFSALMRQSHEYSREEKLRYVDYVIDLLGMGEYADAVVGVPGSGLNVEQRKRLTIGVELAARPKLLLFLDEPTSGLDSQTSWSICNLMEKLTRNGQAILCTIHQPSAILFQRFDRLLLLAKGGKTVYFGEIGRNSQTLIDYFELNGGLKFPAGANPAEHMLEVIGAAPGAHTDIDWPSVWRESMEYQEVRAELSRLRNLEKQPSAVMDGNAGSYQEFAAPFSTQLTEVGKRVAQQYWRTPSYIYSKALLTVGCAFLIGFSFFNLKNTMTGMQNQMFAILVFIFVIIQMIYQIMPIFVTQRTLYEARERASKTYDWKAFMLTNMAVEMFWNSIMAILCFLVWYYPVGQFRNAQATDTQDIRGFLTVLVVLATFLFASTFAHLIIAGCPSEAVGAAIATVLSIMLYAFCGILAGPKDLPRFWIFMYRVNPFTYAVASLMSASTGDAPAACANNEIQRFAAPQGVTCGDYLADYIQSAGGYVLDSEAVGGRQECGYCAMDNTNQYLRSVSVEFENRWRDFGLIWVYIVVNIVGAMVLYWLCRVPKGKKRKNA
ncbi:multidrug resistance protein CDR1 [Sporormia fimetaria CBS 119925]|uniref:Multidrug resistance protein CDR1 n=1 Tax=Sporormia fimetaria CBS 119925 TaxID=1340428 RepID=A0A6A6VAX6_9PLEO|nr:multidrug resistance protein CDR1 [Sporormia fimetaria CBS 119925]